MPPSKQRQAVKKRKAAEPVDDAFDSDESEFPLVEPDEVPTGRQNSPRGRRTQKETSLQERQRILERERQRRALELRKAGASYEQIADQMQTTVTEISRHLTKAMSELTLEPAEDLRRLQIERLNHMMMSLWPQVSAGNIGAISMVERLIARINALTGVEAPVKVQSMNTSAILVIDGDQESYIESLKRMAGHVDEDTRRQMLGMDPVIEVQAAPPLVQIEAGPDGPLVQIIEEPEPVMEPIREPQPLITSKTFNWSQVVPDDEDEEL